MTAHSPTLRTIKMVEKALQDMPNSIMTVPELKRSLPRQVNHNTLMEILEYLEGDLKIDFCAKGITWTKNNSPILRKMILEGKNAEEVFGKSPKKSK